jgi:hypothetical protein
VVSRTPNRYPDPEEMSIDEIVAEATATEAMFIERDTLHISLDEINWLQSPVFPGVVFSCQHHRTMRGIGNHGSLQEAFATALQRFRQVHDMALVMVDVDQTLVAPDVYDRLVQHLNVADPLPEPLVRAMRDRRYS